MKQEDLIKKWLDNSLNPQEFEAFRQLEDFSELTRLNTALQQFKPQELNFESELEKLNFALKSRARKQNNWLKPLLRVAAILAICFGFYTYTSSLNTNFATEIAQKKDITLPDQSKVKLNSKSTLSFNNKEWESNRDIELTGEAYFKVAKGSKFTVHTLSGDVSVLGTEFNIKNRNNLFEVICYEGAVKVEHNNTSRILKPGERFLILDNLLVKKPITEDTSPFWINNESAFKSMPFSQVIAEFERQYKVTFNVNTINTNQLFTGSFAHNNMNVALKTITNPLSLVYTINDNKISLNLE